MTAFWWTFLTRAETMESTRAPADTRDGVRCRPAMRNIKQNFRWVERKGSSEQAPLSVVYKSTPSERVGVDGRVGDRGEGAWRGRRWYRAHAVGVEDKVG